MYKFILTNLAILTWSIFSITISGILYKLNLNKIVLTDNFLESIELISSKNNGSCPSYIIDSIRLAHGIPFEIFMISGLLKYMYLLFFVLSSLALSSLISQGFFSTSVYEFYSPVLSLLIFLNSLYLIFKFNVSLLKKLILFLLTILFSLYIGKQDGFLAFYWFLNSALLPFLILRFNYWRENAKGLY